MSDAASEPEVILVPPAERTLASLPPEVTRMIAALLPTWSRACCVAVSKAVREIFLPWLFEFVELLGPRESLAFGSESTQKLFRLNSSRARSFASPTGLEHAELLYRQQACGLHDVKLGFSPKRRPLIVTDQAVGVLVTWYGRILTSSR